MMGFRGSLLVLAFTVSGVAANAAPAASSLKVDRASAILNPQAPPASVDMAIDDFSTGYVDPGFRVDEAVKLTDAKNASELLAPTTDLLAPLCGTSPNPQTGDFNNDWNTDIVWRNRMTGENLIWTGDGNAGVLTTNNFLPTETDQGWDIRGNGDFGGFGGNFTNEDLVWQHTGGINAIWHLDGNFNVKSGDLIPGSPASWQIQATGDFNCDGFTDIIFRDQSNGSLAVWYMKNNQLLSSALFLNSVPDQSWQIVGAGDFNNDNYPDLVWRNSKNGQNVVWLMVGASLKQTVALQTVNDSTWYIGAVGDYKENGVADLLWRNTKTGQNAVWAMKNNAIFNKAFFLPSVADPNWAIVAPR